MSSEPIHDAPARPPHRSTFRWSIVFGIALFAITYSLSVYATYFFKHTPGEGNIARTAQPSGLESFHNQVYFPVRALVTGINPYSQDYIDYHPGSAFGKQIAMDPVPPSTLLILSPLAFLQLQAAEMAYIAICLLLSIFCASFLLHSATDHPPGIGGTLTLAALMMLCLPGVETFVSYPTVILSLTGVLLAIEYAGESDFLSGLGIVLAFCQPITGAVTLILLLFRRNFSAFAFGVLLMLVFNVLAIAWIGNNSGGVTQAIEDARGVYTNLYTPVVPEHVNVSIDRVDAWSAVARIFDGNAEVMEFPNLKSLIVGGILLLAVIALLAERDRTQLVGLVSRSGMLIALVTVLCFYQFNGALYLLWIPVIGLLIEGWRSRRAFSLPLRFILGLLVVLPLFNYFVTPYAMKWLGISPMGATAASDAEPATYSLSALLESWQVANPDLVQWQVVVTANSVMIALAIIIIALRMIFSSFVDRQIIEQQQMERA